MIKYVEGDMFSYFPQNLSGKKGLLAHVVNDRGGWGKGFVLPLAKRFPAAKKSYLEWAAKPPVYKTPFEQGRVFLLVAEPNVVVANMCAQGLGGKRPLNYGALVKCMYGVAQNCDPDKYEIHAPMFGSDLAGGRWDFIEELIYDIWIKYGFDVTIYHLEPMVSQCS